MLSDEEKKDKNSNMIRGAILAMRVDNDTKQYLFDYLDALEERSRFLSCLQQVGVDNWGGYEDAQDLYSEGE